LASRTVDFILNLKGDAERKAKSTERAMGGLVDKGAAVAAGFAAAGAAAIAMGTALVSLTNDIANTVDQMNTLSKASGLSIETVAGLRNAARSTGKSLEDLVPRKLAKNMFSVQRGATDMKEAFRQAGVEVITSTGELRDADDVYRDLINSLGAMENKTQAAALAATTMGNNGRQMLSAFENSEGLDGFVAQAEKFGIRVGPAALKATSDWQKATGQLSLAFDELKQSTLDAFGTGLTTAVNNAAGLVVFFGRLMKEILDDASKRWKAFFSAISSALGGDFAGAGISLSRALIPDPTALARAIGKAAEDANQFMQGPIADAVGGGGAGGNGGGGGVSTSKAKAAPVAIVDDKVSQWDAWMQNMDVSNRLNQEQIAKQAMLVELQEQATASLAGMKSSVLPVVGGLIRGLGEVMTNMDSKVRDLLRGAEAAPEKIGTGVETTLTKVLPRFLSRLPEFLGGLLVKMPAAIARGVVNAIPALLKGIWRAMKRAVKAIGEFFKGGKDRNILTGKKEKFLGTSFKKGKFSLLGFFNDDDQAFGGKGGRKNKRRGFATGGFVDRTGPAFVHAGERIVPATGASTSSARAASGGLGGLSIGTVNIRANDPRDFMRQLRRMQGDFGSGDSLDPKVA